MKPEPISEMNAKQRLSGDETGRTTAATPARGDGSGTKVSGHNKSKRSRKKENRGKQERKEERKKEENRGGRSRQ